MNAHHQIWEILVPAKDNDGKDIDLSYHRKWDSEVRAITDGLTILSQAKGQWRKADGLVQHETMIPVRVACEGDEIDSIIDFTLEHYEQEAVMAYYISEQVIIRGRRDT